MKIAHSDAVGRDGLITEAMDEWKIPGLAVAVLQNGEVALVRAYGLRDVEAGLQVLQAIARSYRDLLAIIASIQLALRRLAKA